MDKNTAVYITQAKNPGLGFVLTLVFGGLGLLYANIIVGLIIFVVEVVLFFTIVGWVIIPFIHLLAAVLSLVLINNHNKKLLTKL